MSRGRTGGAVFAAMALAAALLVPASPGSAQRLQVTRVQDLTFHTVLAGGTVVIPPSAPAAGKFTVRSVPNRQLIITFTLPVALEHGAALLPIRFGPASAAWSFTDDVATAAPFDPAVPLTVQVPPGGRTLHVWIGGQVGTSPEQPPGGYTGPLTITAVLS